MSHEAQSSNHDVQKRTGHNETAIKRLFTITSYVNISHAVNKL